MCIACFMFLCRGGPMRSREYVFVTAQLQVSQPLHNPFPLVGEVVVTAAQPQPTLGESGVLFFQVEKMAVMLYVVP